MQTYVMSMQDDGDGVYEDVIVAPDHETARRLFAMRMLIGYERNLHDAGETSLDDYAPTSALIDDWIAEKSISCVACGCGSTRPLEPREMAFMGISPIEHGGKAHVCLSCAATWIATGTYTTMREEIEAKARASIEALASFEARSLLGEDDEHDDADGGAE